MAVAVASAKGSGNASLRKADASLGVDIAVDMAAEGRRVWHATCPFTRISLNPGSRLTLWLMAELA